MTRLNLLFLGVLLTCPVEVSASEATATSQLFLGWSEDGNSWAVISTDESSGYQELVVFKHDKRVLTLCSQGEDDATNCRPGKRTRRVKLDVMRIDIETHKYLKPYRLKRARAKWRSRFKKAYSLKGTNYGKSWNGKRCSQGWAVTDRITKKPRAGHREAKGCLRALGGYLHPNGNLALIKQEHATWSAGADEFWTDDARSFVLAVLSAP